MGGRDADRGHGVDGAVLLLRRPVARRFGPHAAYALWALPALRMILPPIPNAWRPVEFAPIEAATEPAHMTMVVPVAGVPALPDGLGIVDLPMAMMVVWAAGAVLFAGYHIVAYRRFCARILASAMEGGVADGGVKLIRTPCAAGPLAFGVWRRYVATPIDFADRYDAQEQALALAHELGHHARGDLVANWAALIVLSLHWFNPVAWAAFRAFRADQEMACDAMVLACATPAVRLAYATAIVKSAHGGTVSAACHLHNVNELKGRLIMLSKHHIQSRTTRRVAGVGTIALAVLGLGATASGTQAAATVRTGVEHATGVDLAQVEASAAAALRPIVSLPAVVQVPQTPMVPVNPPRPPAAVAPAAPVTAPNAETTKRIVVRRIDRDGTVTSPAYADVPEVIERNCGTDKTGRREMIMTQKDGRTTRMIVCTDRVERVAADAALHAEAGQQAAIAGRAAARAGLTAALSGLRAARASIEAQTELSAAQKREALNGIDEGLREIEQEIASEG